MKTGLKAKLAGGGLTDTLLKVMPTRSTHSRRFVRVALVALVLSAVGVYVWMRPVGRLQVHDPRFQVLSIAISRATNHVIYPGNQLEGRFRYWIASKLGLDVAERPILQLSTGSAASRALLVRYRGDLPFRELDGLNAVISSDDGSTLQTSGSRFFDKDSNSFYTSFLVLGSPGATTSYHVQFTIPSHEQPVATWFIGSL